MLLEFVAAEDHQAFGMIFPQHDLDELLSERTGSTGHQDHLVRPIHEVHFRHSLGSSSIDLAFVEMGKC